jgi:hypothetical protein
MISTDAQVRLAMKERRKGRSQQQAAVKANIKSRQTVAKYEKLGRLPSELKQVRGYRTRVDPFEGDWPEVEQMLENAPELEAKVLFEWLCEREPGRYEGGQLRTFQRRVSEWRGLHQPQIAVLAQEHQPGEVLQTDGTWMNELAVSIEGKPFKHLLIHSVLTYSNWEWGRIVQSESLAALRLGLQSSLQKLGYVPEYHQTDNSTAATYQLSRAEGEEVKRGRGYTRGYLELLKHYGLEPRVIHVGCPEENGDIESANGSLKRALKQHLLLRGSRDFASLDEYEQFVFEVMERRNNPRQQRLNEELAVMKPLTAAPLGLYQEQRVKVNRGSLIRVQKNSYSVPSSLINRQVRVQIYEWHLEVYYAGQCVETMPRLVGEHKHRINYHHLIDSLLRKPGGFRHYRYRRDLFPRLVFRQAWDQLNGWYAPRKADLIYLRVLHLAARHLESEVAEVLGRLLNQGQRWDENDVERQLRPLTIAIPQLSATNIDLTQYDHLLQEAGYASA